MSRGLASALLLLSSIPGRRDSLICFLDPGFLRMGGLLRGTYQKLRRYSTLRICWYQKLAEVNA